MMDGEANSMWSTILNGWDWRVTAEGWHVEQIPSGNEGCAPVGQGVMTDRDVGESGGRSAADEAVGGREERSLRRYAW